MSHITCSAESSSVVVPTVAPSDDGGIGVIVGVVVVIVAVLILLVVLICIILCVWYRNKGMSKKGIYSPHHFAEEPNNRPTDTLELKYAGAPAPVPAPLDEDPASPFSASALAKEEEANLDNVPVSTTPTEGEAGWVWHYCADSAVFVCSD